MWAEVSLVLSQFTRLTDRGTDGRTDIWLVAILQLHTCSVAKGLCW